MIAWHRIDDLREEVGEESFDEIVALFLEEADGAVSRLRDHPDPARYAEDLHFLNGGAMNLGFTAVAAACRLGEARARQGAAVDIASVIDSYETSRDAFVTTLAARAGALP